MMKNVLQLLLMLMLAVSLKAQQEVILTKYTYNPMFFNPAFAGSNGLGEGSLQLQYRNQWLGLEGAPQTLMAGFEKSMFDNRLGIGGSLSREGIGVNTNINFGLNTAYRIQLDKGYLAGGLRVGYTNFRHDFSKLNVRDIGDVYDISDYQYSAFTVGAGLYYHSDGLYLGLSVPALARIVTTREGVGNRRRHIYVHGGMLLGDTYEKIRLEPIILVKYEYAVPLQYTIGVNVWLNEDLAIGGHWRSKDAVSLSVDFRLKEQYRIAAAYDFTLSDIRTYSGGSLELLFGYRFNTEKDNPKVKNYRNSEGF